MNAHMRDQYAEALREVAFLEIATEHNLTILPTEYGAQVPPHWSAEADLKADPYLDAVLAVRDAEVERLEDIIASTQRAYAEDYGQAVAENRVLRARLAAVEAVCDDLERKPYGEQLTSSSVIRAVLASVPQPSDSEPACTCTSYVVDYSDPDRYHAENIDREDDPACPVHGDSETHAPCCDACGGSGASDEASSNGLCWDCRGTGCAHEPSEPAPDADREAGEW